MFYVIDSNNTIFKKHPKLLRIKTSQYLPTNILIHYHPISQRAIYLKKN